MNIAKVFENLRRLFVRVAKRVQRWLIKAGKALYKARRPKKLSRKEKKQLQQTQAAGLLQQHPRCRHQVPPYETIKAQKADPAAVGIIIQRTETPAPDTPTWQDRLEHEEAVIEETERRERAAAMASAKAAHMARQREAERQNLEKAIQDTENKLRITKKTVQRKKLETQLAQYGKLLAELPAVEGKNNI